MIAKMKRNVSRLKSRSFLCVLLPFFAGAVVSAKPPAFTGQVTEVRVQPGQTLNEALADVGGPVRVRLPAGVTEHDAAITRRATVIIEGAGRDKTILRAAAAVPLIHQTGVWPLDPFDGDVRISDLTYDRAHFAGWNLDPRRKDKETTQKGATILSTSASNNVVFENVKIYRFDFGGGGGELIQGLGVPVYKWNSPDMARHDYVGFHNVIIDFKADGGVRHRHTSGIGGPSLAFSTDRFVFDRDSLIQGHLTQYANPEYTDGTPPAGRGNAGSLSALRFNIWDHALIAGTIREIDYGIIRKGLMQSPDAVIELTGNFPESGFADQTWIGTEVGGGSVIFRGVTLTSEEANPWHDRGLKIGESGRKRVGSVLVEDCTILGRVAPIHALKVDKLTVRNTTIRGGGLASNYTAILAHGVNELVVENVSIGPNKEFTPPQLYEYAIAPPRNKEASIRVENVRATVLRGLFDREPKGSLHKKNITITQATYPPLPPGIEIGLLPRHGFGFGLRGKHAGTPPVPGTFVFPADRYDNPGMPFTAVAGEPQLDPKKGSGRGAIAYDDNYLRLWFSSRFDRGMTWVTQDTGLSGATRLRIGVSGARPGKAEGWYEIDIAATDSRDGEWGGHPKYAAATEVRRYPGGRVVDIDLEASTGSHGGHAVWLYLVAVPWRELGIDPSKGEVSLDLAYIDVKNGELEGVFALDGRTGLLGERSTNNYKRAGLLYYKELERLKAWFEEEEGTRKEQAGKK